MFLIPLWDTESASAAWQVYAISDGTQCQVVDSLEEWLEDRSLRGYANGIFAIIGHLTSGQMGPDLLLRNSGLCHEAVSGRRIFRIRKGALRLYWFYGEGQKVIICPHAEVKRRNDVSVATQRALTKAHDAYTKAFADGEIVILNNGGNHEQVR